MAVSGGSRSSEVDIGISLDTLFAEGDDAVWDEKALHWFIYYSFPNEEINYDLCFLCKEAQLHFPSEEAAEAAVKAVGEERVKKYYFGIKEA